MANKKFLNPINLVNLASDPSTASEGDIYYNTTDNAVKVYANGSWVGIGAGGGSETTVSATAPLSPTTGDAWYKNDTGEFYVYDGTYWVEVNGVIEGTNSFKTISVSGQDSVVADSFTDTLSLVAGTNVSITTDATADSITINADSKATSSVYLVRNNTGSTILKGTLVSASGAEPSGRIDVEPFAAVGGINSELTVMGMATETISNGVNGEVLSFGTLTGIDTRGDTISPIAVGDETWAEGDILFAHPTVAGKLTKVRPQHDLAVAFITVRHASTGQIAVRIVPGNNHLEWMHDVTIDTPADNEVLAYDSASGLWKNQTASEAGLSASDHNHTVDSLSNVVITGTPTDGQALVWDTTTSKWINETVSAVTDISSLTDVTISGTIADNEVLAYDTATSQWINQTTAEAGLVTLTGTETLTNKTLTTPKINEDVTLTATSTELNILDGATLTTTELNYVDGVTSAIQTQIDTKAPSADPTFTGTVVLPSTTSIGDVSATEIGYLDGVTSAIQTQISSKASSSHTHSYQEADSDLTAIAGITSGVGLLKRLGPDTWSIDTNAYITGSSPTINTSLIAGTSTFNLINSIATTVNFAGAATTLIMGSTDAGASTTIRTPAIATTSTSLDLFNTTATTVNFGGAATTFNLGGTPTGSLTATLFGNATTTTKTINIGTGGASGSETNINIGSSTSGATGTVSVYPSTNFVGTVTVPTPTSSGHATTKGYVDALAAGITVKAQVVYVSSANLNATYANGTSDSSGGLGVGATLTGNVDGALILDGPEVEAGQRVLIKNQTDAKHNGIYVVTFAGDGDDPFILTRATDFNGNSSTNGIVKNGAYIFVTSGTNSANDSYVVSLGGTSSSPSGAIKFGTDNVSLAQYSGVPNNISTLGYVTTGTWAATPIDKDFIDTEIARTNDPVFTGHVTVPSPTDDTDAANKEYVDDLIFASLPYLPDIIPLDDLRYEFNGMDSRFVPKFQGEQVAINNPLRLLVTINGIIQTVDFPEYVWQSMLPREGFMVDNDGYIAFSEVVPVGSTFDARVMLGPNVNSIKKGYPFRAVDILLGA
jgi:hypothetical protein